MIILSLFLIEDTIQKYLTIVNNTDCRMADAFAPKEVGGDHFRSTAVFLTQAHPKQTQGSDLHVGTSFDQVFAQTYGHETPIPSLQLTIENVDQAGGCSYGYACAYTDTAFIGYYTIIAISSFKGFNH